MKRIVLSLAFVFAAIALAEAKECVAPIDTSDFLTRVLVGAGVDV